MNPACRDCYNQVRFIVGVLISTRGKVIDIDYLYRIAVFQFNDFLVVPSSLRRYYVRQL